MSEDILNIGAFEFRSRLFTGTGKYPDLPTAKGALEASGCEVVTVADSDVTVYSLIINQDLGDRWHYQFEHDLLLSDSRTGTASDDYESYSIANYLFYDFNDCWRGGLRVEWLRDDDGTLAGFDPTRPAAPGSFYNLTLGLNWHPREHLRVRPEIRRDWQARDSNAIPPAFDDGTSTNQWLFACDVIFEF